MITWELYSEIGLANFEKTIVTLHFCFLIFALRASLVLEVFDFQEVRPQ